MLNRTNSVAAMKPLWKTTCLLNQWRSIYFIKSLLLSHDNVHHSWSNHSARVTLWMHSFFLNHIWVFVSSNSIILVVNQSTEMKMSFATKDDFFISMHCSSVYRFIVKMAMLVDNIYHILIAMNLIEQKYSDI